VKPAGDQKVIAAEIEALRGDMGRILSELDRRRRDLLDPRIQLRRHPAVAVGAGVVAAALGGTVALLIWRRRRQSTPAARARELGRAMGRLLHNPRNVAKEPSMGVKIATAAGSAAVTLMVKQLVSRALARIPPPQRA
jgi:hypothetical protein